MGCVPLFARQLGILTQQLLDTLSVGTKHGLEFRTRHGPACWWLIAEGFSDGTAVSPFFSCQLMDALVVNVIAAPNPFPFLFVHPCHSLFPACACRGNHAFATVVFPILPNLSASGNFFPLWAMWQSLDQGQVQVSLSRQAFAFPAQPDGLMKVRLVAFDNHTRDQISLRRSAFLKDRSTMGGILLIAENTRQNPKVRTTKTRRFRPH